MEAEAREIPMATLRTLARRFKSDTSGSAAIVFGLAIIPICVMMGMAVDLSKQVTNKKHLQATMDSAALASAAAYAAGDANYKAVAQKFFDENAPAEIKGATPVVDVSVDTTALKLKASTTATFKNSIMGLVGQETTDIPVSTTVSLPVFSDYHKGEIVLVLDYSKSMDDSLNGTKKYVAMRDEAAKLINALSQDGANTDVKFGLVPFSGEVYATMPKKYWYNQGTTSTNYSTCTRDRKYNYNVTDATPSGGTKDGSRWGQPLANDDPHGKGNTSGNGCSDYSNKKVTVRPLTTDHSGTVTQVNAMKPVGYTNISLGMEFGWHLLSPNEPFTQGAAYNTEDTLKAIVLLTDGAQTTHSWGPGGTNTVENGEANLETLCANVKAKGIRILTVSYDLPAGDNETRLRNCASSPEDFFDADTQAELAEAFGVITNKLARNMYITE